VLAKSSQTASSPSLPGRDDDALGNALMRSGSIYVELIEAALSEREQLEPVPSASEALAQLVGCRRKVIWSESPQIDQGWAISALADQVAYDIALIRYARCIGIDCDPRHFGFPGAERRQIERMLASRGIPLDPLDG
jgi:hypothetical protein